jgi:putative copper export protein
MSAVFDGLEPSFNYSNALVVILFESLTLIVELMVVWAFMRHVHADDKMMRFALFGSLASNLVSFTMGAAIYTYLYGFSWLVTVNYGDDLETAFALLGFFIMIYLFALAGILAFFIRELYSDTEIGEGLEKK